MRRLALLLVAAAPLAAQGLDPDALAGMDAEVRGDWVRAVEAFERSAGEKPSPEQRTRLRMARARGKAFWKAELATLTKQKRYTELAQAVALASLVAPKDSAVARARKLVVKNGLKVADIPADAKGAVPQYPTRSAGARLRCWSTMGSMLGQGQTLIDKCLDWLVKTQGENGTWDAKTHGASSAYDTGVTALAMLALLTQAPDALEGERGKALEKAAEFLLSKQTEKGSFSTVIGEMYCSAFATEALAEYAVLSGRADELRARLQKAADFLVGAQNPGAGWRYAPRDGESDTSVTCRMVCAFDRLRRAGVEIPASAIRGAVAWTKSMTDPEYGQVGYNMPGGSCARPEELQNTHPPEYTQAMTAAGALLRLYAGEDPSKLSRSLLLLDETKPLVRYPDMYYWEIGARAWQAALGYVPRNWYAALVAGVESCLGKDGGAETRGPWSRRAGRVYATAMCALALSAPYRERQATLDKGLSASAFRRSGSRRVAVFSSTATGIYLDAREVLKVRARGFVIAWDDGAKFGPGGTDRAPKGLKRLVKKGEFGCLLGRIGPEGKPFRIKMDDEIRAPACGQLYLLVNDAFPEDNSGGFTVDLEIAR